MPASRRRYRPPVGFPTAEERRGRWQAPIISIVLHALAFFALLIPTVALVKLVAERRQWGLHGLVLGGGGGAQPERVQYVRPAMPARAPTTRPVVRPPPKPKPPPVITPPQPVPPQPVPVAPPGPESAATGAPAGTGTPSAGPGSGGGTGAGTGPGVGNGKGPGTGGDPAARKLRAVPPETIVAGLDAPKDARPRHLVAIFIVASTGEAKFVSFTQTNNGGLNRQLRDEFEQMTRSRWQPAALDGVSVPDTVAYVVELP